MPSDRQPANPQNTEWTGDFAAPRVGILGVGVHAQRFADAIATLTRWAQQRQARYVCTVPVYTLMLAVEQPDVAAALQGAAMVTADGMPIVWVQQRRGFPYVERVYGPDLLLALCEQTRHADVSHFFLGGAAGVAEQLAAALTTRFPGLRVEGTLTPSVITTAVDPALVDQLNQAAPNVIWVGLGSPKQDLWMAAYQPHVSALMIGVGAAFDFVAGSKPQAPLWMRRRGLEWLFRLIHEPRRLGQRYVVYNTRFLWALWRSRQHERSR